MERTLTIDGRQVSFKSTGAFLLRYKAQFQRDGLADIIKLIESFDVTGKKITNYETFDLQVFYNIVWTLAKTADKSIPEPMVWLDTFDEFPLVDVLSELTDMITSTLMSTKKN
jgi:hypothetical protein